MAGGNEDNVYSFKLNVNSQSCIMLLESSWDYPYDLH